MSGRAICPKTHLEKLNDEIRANAVELDFANRYENGYDYPDEEFYILQEKQKKLIEQRDWMLLEDVANSF